MAQLPLQAYACVFFVIFTGKGSGQKTRAMSKNDSQIVQAQYNAGLVWLMQNHRLKSKANKGET